MQSKVSRLDFPSVMRITDRLSERPESVLDLTLENSGSRYCWKVEGFLTGGQKDGLLSRGGSVPVSGGYHSLTLT